MSEAHKPTIIVKWCGKEYPITELTDQDTVAVLRNEIFKKTQVRPERQKLINLKYKGKAAPDEVKLSSLELKPNYKLMMVGSTEAAIADVCQQSSSTSQRVVDFDDAELEDEAVENSPINLEKVQQRVRDCKINELSPPREGKHLLVVDIDYTLFDLSALESGTLEIRPHLHEFFESAYEHYDIVIWSATAMQVIEDKVQMLGMKNHPNYKIMFYLDYTAMISVRTKKRGVVGVKALGVIWSLYPQYSSKNTIILDDIRRNFLMNRKSGLRVRAFKKVSLKVRPDTELLKLSKYLRDIALHCDDFNELDHRKWEQYDPQK